MNTPFTILGMPSVSVKAVHRPRRRSHLSPSPPPPHESTTPSGAVPPTPIHQYLSPAGPYRPAHHRCLLRHRVRLWDDPQSIFPDPHLNPYCQFIGDGGRGI